MEQDELDSEVKRQDWSGIMRACAGVADHELGKEMEEVEEIVRGWGGGRRERLHLRVREDNVAAREMYVRNGYEEIIDGADGSAPSSPRGEGRGILLMGKEL